MASVAGVAVMTEEAISSKTSRGTSCPLESNEVSLAGKFGGFLLSQLFTLFCLIQAQESVKNDWNCNSKKVLILKIHGC